MPLHSLPDSPEALAAAPGLALGLGAVLLVAGRKVFWLFVAAIGFFAAMRLADEVLGDDAEKYQQWILIGSIVAGLVGATLALVVQKVAIALAGAVTGAYVVDQFLRRGLEVYPNVAPLFLIVAAIIGAVLMVIVFEWALIFLTSLAGAHLIAQFLPLQRGWLLAAYVLLTALGVALQNQWRRGRSG